MNIQLFTRNTQLGVTRTATCNKNWLKCLSKAATFPENKFSVSKTAISNKDTSLYVCKTPVFHKRRLFGSSETIVFYKKTNCRPNHSKPPRRWVNNNLVSIRQVHGFRSHGNPFVYENSCLAYAGLLSCLCESE